MTVVTTSTTSTTDLDLKTLILAAIRAAIGERGVARGDLTLWSVIRRQVPGSWEAKHSALFDLIDTGDVVLVQARGRPLVGIGDDTDRLIAAKRRVAGRQPLITVV